VLINSLLVMHIAVLGYWLGSELVINSTFRYVSYAATLPFAERDRLLDHVLDVDQHVRYALILQLGLGVMLAGLLGYLPGGGTLASVAATLALAWLVLVEATHRLRKTAPGQRLARIDAGLRYAVMLLLVLPAARWLMGAGQLPVWLTIKLVLFAGVIASGLGIRLALVRYFQVWREIQRGGTGEAHEARLRAGYASATGVLVVLWIFILGIVLLSVLKPF
jgi:hypothetical protein